MSTNNQLFRNGLKKFEEILETCEPKHKKVVEGYLKVLQKLKITTDFASCSPENVKLRHLHSVMCGKLYVKDIK